MIAWLTPAAKMLLSVNSAWFCAVGLAVFAPQVVL